MSRAYVSGSIIDRLWPKVDRRGPADCWLWKAGSSRSGRREVNYGCISEGQIGGRTWRVNRLVLLLKTAPVDVPRDGDEGLVAWLRRANRYYAAMDASHICDVSLCCNPDHLEWLPHGENVRSQQQRKALIARADELADVAAAAAPSGEAVSA